jgi:hypothetical protein
MKTTLIIDDVILKKAREQAAVRDLTVSEVVNQSLRAYLHPVAAVGQTANFSMPVYGSAAQPGRGITPGQIAELRDEGR